MSDNREKPAPRANDKYQGIGVRGESSDAPPTGEAGIKFDEIWETIREGKWIILLTCILVTGGIVAYTLTQEPVYRAVSIVSVTPQQSGEATLVSLGESRDLANEVGVLQYSAELAARVAERMQDSAQARAGAEFPVLRTEDGDTLSSREAGQRLFNKVSFTPISQRNMIEIAAQSEVPEEAALIANIYADEYRAFSRERSRASVSAARRFLEEQASKREEEIQQLQEEWEQFARNNEIVARGEDGSRVVEQYAGLESRRSELQFQLEQAQRTLSNLQEQLSEYKPQLQQRVEEEQATTELRKQIEALNTRIADLKARAETYYVNNEELRNQSPEALRANGYGELAEIRERIQGFEERKNGLVQDLATKASGGEVALQEGATLQRVSDLRSRITEQRLQVNQLQSQIQAIDQRLAAYDTKLQDIPSQQIERRRLEERLAQAKEFHNAVLSKLQKVIIKEESELGYVQQVRQASVPTLPVSPNMNRNVVLGILLGLAFGIGLAFVRRAVLDRLRTPGDVQDKGYSLVGVIPNMDAEIEAVFGGKETVELNGRDVDTRLLPMVDPWSPISENYRLVRTNLQYGAGDESPQVTLITSPEKGDGKTLTAINMAVTMAQSGQRTLLIDADLRRANAHQLLQLSPGPGLAEYLAGGDNKDKYVVSTDVDQLSFLPAGQSENPPAEAMGSDRMEQLLDHMRRRFDVIIVDTPPVLAVSDPVLLATQADATLVVVSADQTDLEALQVTKQTLEAVDVPIAGIVLNRYENGEAKYGYGYGYGYSDEYARRPQVEPA